MKKLLLSLAILLGSFGMVRPAQAGMGQNNIGPSVIFGSGETSIGVSARFAIILLNPSLCLHLWIVDFLTPNTIATSLLNSNGLSLIPPITKLAK